MERIERYRGCLLGLAAGDAVGTTLEFKPPGSFRAALVRFERTREPYSGSADPMSAGNGSIMRLAPVPLAYADQQHLIG